MKLKMLFVLLSVICMSFITRPETKKLPSSKISIKADSIDPNLIPIVVLSNGSSGGSIGSGEIKIQKALLVMSENSATAMKDICHVTKFTITVYPGTNKKDPVAYTNNGYVFEDITVNLLSTVKSRDKVVFSDVKGRCSGDSAERVFNELTFKIK